MGRAAAPTVVDASIVAGARHACVVVGGRLFCWGDGRDGQVQVGVRQIALAPTLAGELGAVEAASGGERHTCVVVEGEARCFGDNRRGQLGDGTTEPRAAVVAVDGLPEVAEVAAGGGHSCARTVAGELYCWGHDGLERGAEGDLAPRRVEGVGVSVQVVVGRSHTCTRDAEGRVRCFGGRAPLPGARDDLRALEGIDDAVLLAARGRRTCALRRLGDISCWAVGGMPEAVAGATAPELLGVGRAHVCALLGSGGLSCAGADDHGQLGGVGGARRASMVAVHDLVATGLAVGDDFACALTPERRVLCFGDDAFGQHGDGVPSTARTPTAVAGVIDARSVALGAAHSCFVDGAGAVHCFGSGSRGQRGRPPGAATAQPRPVAGLEGVRTLALFAHHGFATTMDGTLLRFGEALQESIASTAPSPVPGFTRAAPGARHGCGRSDTGELRCWGQLYGDWGPAPGARVLSESAEVYGGGSFACATTAERRLHCWGRGELGQLGDGTRRSRRTPAPIALDAPVAHVALGARHGCVVLEAGTVHCFGDGSRGQLGGVDHALAPMLVEGLGGVAELAAGRHHTCARHSSGEVSCWGDDTYGQLGRGAARESAAPARVVGVHDAVSIAAGGRHSCAVRSGGQLLCWGDGGRGQLGDPGRGPAAGPTEVVGLRSEQW